jgi:membrane-associated protein
MHILEYVLHFDKFIQPVMHVFGPYIYVVLFLIVFATCFVLTSFLPGDSLLFVAGSLAGAGYLNIFLTYILFLTAAILGNMFNYWMGNKFGHIFFTHEKSRWFNQKNLKKTHEYFDKYGGKTIIITRFIPVIRSFAAFVAGMGTMTYKQFMIYNVIGGFLWATLLTFTGYFFGGTKIVKDNFEFVVLVIVVISVIPLVIEYLKYKKENTKK